jgi:hypothetical protein
MLQLERRPMLQQASQLGPPGCYQQAGCSHNPAKLLKRALPVPLLPQLLAGLLRALQHPLQAAATYL